MYSAVDSGLQACMEKIRLIGRGYPINKCAVLLLTYFSMASARVPSFSFSMNAIMKSYGTAISQW